MLRPFDNGPFGGRGSPHPCGGAQALATARWAGGFILSGYDGFFIGNLPEVKDDNLPNKPPTRYPFLIYVI